MSVSAQTGVSKSRGNMTPLDRLLASARVRRWARSRHAWAVADASTWFVAIGIAALIRRLYVSEPLDLAWLAATSLLSAAIFLLFARWRGLYDRGRVRGSYDDVMRLVQASGLAGLVLLGLVVSPIGLSEVAGTIPVLATAVAVSGTLSLRLFARLARARTRTLTLTASRIPTIVLGAGAAARHLLEPMQSGADSPWHLVALLDDDPAKRGERVGGMTVLGDRSRLAELTWRYEARLLIVCIADADAATLHGICRDAGELGLDVLVLPSESERLGRPLTTADFRPVRLDDLVGRTRLSADDAAVRGLLHGKNVLITGAGGSLGAEITRRVSHAGAGRVVLADIDQPALHAVQLDVQRLGESFPEAVIADVREDQQVRELFDVAAPDVVIHAAAIHDAARVDALPEEAWRTNVIGTANVLESAQAHEVALFVNVSATAAGDHHSTLGASELLTERLTCSVAGDAAGTFVSVRVPDLVGARHSALSALHEQLRRDVTTGLDTTVQPGFLRVADAAQLVLEVMTTATRGRTYILAGRRSPEMEEVVAAMAWAGPSTLYTATARRSSAGEHTAGRVVT